MKMNWQTRFGLWRSIITYYWKPFNHKRLKNFYSAFISEGDICFDIGAHLGNRIDAWLPIKPSKIIAVDPQPVCFNYMKNKFGKNSNVVLIQKAIGNKPGKATFHINQKAPTVSSLSGKDWQEKIQSKTPYALAWDKKMEVEVITLDQLIEEYGLPVFCKIDVEDFEVQALEGLSYAIPFISFEYFIPTIDRAISCVEILDKIENYEYNISYGESQVLEYPEWKNYNEILNILNSYKNSDRSGDVYAKLKNYKK